MSQILSIDKCLPGDENLNIFNRELEDLIFSTKLPHDYDTAAKQHRSQTSADNTT